jgi:hypothetical protein
MDYKARLERPRRYIKNIVSLYVISTPSAMLRMGSGRNLRSLTSVRDDNRFRRQRGT